MSGSVFIENKSPFAGFALGTSAEASAAPRTEITYDQWVNQTTQQWAQANPNAAKSLLFRIGGANVIGIGSLIAGGIAFALGHKAVGGVLGAIGAAGIAYSAIAAKRELVGQTALVIGQN